MNEKQIRDRAHRQHVIAAGYALDKGVFVIQRDNIAAAQLQIVPGIELVFFQRFDM